MLSSINNAIVVGMVMFHPRTPLTKIERTLLTSPATGEELLAHGAQHQPFSGIALVEEHCLPKVMSLSHSRLHKIPAPQGVLGSTFFALIQDNSEAPEHLQNSSRSELRLHTAQFFPPSRLVSFPSIDIDPKNTS